MSWKTVLYCFDANSFVHNKIRFGFNLYTLIVCRPMPILPVQMRNQLLLMRFLFVFCCVYWPDDVRLMEDLMKNSDNYFRMFSKLLMFRLLLVVFCNHAITQGYPIYQDQIPNGHIVPSPCYPNVFWPGVGHESILGGEARNPFGLDFAANGQVSHRTDSAETARGGRGFSVIQSRIPARNLSRYSN